MLLTSEHQNDICERSVCKCPLYEKPGTAFFLVVQSLMVHEDPLACISLKNIIQFLCNYAKTIFLHSFDEIKIRVRVIYRRLLWLQMLWRDHFMRRFLYKCTEVRRISEWKVTFSDSASHNEMAPAAHLHYNEAKPNPLKMAIFWNQVISYGEVDVDAAAKAA